MHPEFHCAGRTALTLLSLAAALAGCNGSHTPSVNEAPGFVVDATSIHYDGLNDDLLTGGIGKGGLGSTFPPVIDSPPTPAQIRRLAIYNNYRALLDTSINGGFGTLYGPNVTATGSVTADAGMIAGTEFTAYDDDGSGANVMMVAQVPDTFDRDAPCLVVAASSGSRGVYGAISTAEWGLKRGCAVAMTDKGTGAGPHDLKNDAVYLRDGIRAAAAQAAASGASAPHFRSGLSAGELASFNAVTPDRFAFKHAHSGRNPEADWGLYVLHAAKFGLWAINQAIAPVNFDGTHQIVATSSNTMVIAAGASNAGGAAIAAAEQDTEGLIDAVAVSEPNVEMPAEPGVTVQRGGTSVATTARTLFDYGTVADVFQLCASQSPQAASAPGLALVPAQVAANRCASLHAKGLLAATTLAAQGDEALERLRGYGWEPESSILHASLAAFEVAPAVAVTYANALARAKVSDNLCGYSFAATTAAGAVTALDAVSLEQMAANGNGIPPSAGVQLVNNANPGGPLRDLLSTSPSTGLQDANLDGALCLGDLLDGSDAKAQAVRASIDATRRTGRLNGKPVVIVHGRADALLPVNHTARPYAALEHSLDGDASKLSYVEVTNAQHFDAFIGLQASGTFPPTLLLPGYDTRYIPLHVYFERSLDAVYAYLKNGTPLPPSQVVRTLPRGGTAGAAPALSASNVPAIASAPSAGDTITFTGSTIVVPD
jgi:hydroxybutyrate-dimer hydrolase